jgi:hypothetical protein
MEWKFEEWALGIHFVWDWACILYSVYVQQDVVTICIKQKWIDFSTYLI